MILFGWLGRFEGVVIMGSLLEYEVEVLLVVWVCFWVGFKCDFVKGDGLFFFFIVDYLFRVYIN